MLANILNSLLFDGLFSCKGELLREMGFCVLTTGNWSFRPYEGILMACIVSLKKNQNIYRSMFTEPL